MGYMDIFSFFLSFFFGGGGGILVLGGGVYNSDRLWF